MPPLATGAGQLEATSPLLLPLALLLEQPRTLPPPSAETVAALLGLALLSTALACIVHFGLLATAGASSLLLVTFLIPPTAIRLRVGVLGESPAPLQLLGLALVGAGLAAIDGRVPAFLRRPLRSTRPR